MKNVSIKKAVVLEIAVILVSIAFIPVVNAQNCNLIIRLPANPVTMVVDKTASNSYFDTTLSNVPSGYDVSNGDYLGWCIDLDHNIANNTSYQVSLYSSYNTSMPSYLWHNNLSKVNYILNNKQGSWQQVQNAMWYLLDFGDNGLNSDGWAMVNDAIANGSSFCPGVGDVIAIIADAGTDVQYTVIELQVPVYTLTVNTEGSGSVNPSAGTYASGTVVNVTATPDIGWTFNNWSGDVPSGHETDNPVTITMDSNKTVTAHFTEDQYTLTVIIDGNGTVIKNPDQTTYTYGTIVELTANPDSGWSFSHWSSDLSGSNNPKYITMDSDKTVTAHFTEDQYTLTVIIDGNGTVIKNPDQTTYTYGTIVELTANPDSGWSFSHWSSDLSGSNNPEYITMDSDKTVTAHFTYVAEYTLTIIIDGICGWVIKSPDYPTYPHGTVVMLTAQTVQGWSFTHWSGDLNGSNNPEYITMDSDKTVTAHFTVNYYTLNIIIDGNGTVNKSPDKPVYHYGENVTLTAVPDPGWVFDHWSGDLTGSNNPTYIKMYGGTTVTAHFTTTEYTLDINIDGNGYVIKDPDHATFPYDTTVELTAVPDPGWVFDHWSGDLTGGNNPETIFMDDNKIVTAHFSIAEPPEKPIMGGPANGKAGVEYNYSFTTIDPYESDIYYYIEWGDGEFEDWLGPYSSGEKVTLSHTWDEEDIYTIQAKARNIYGAESDWATLEVEMPVNQQVQYPFIQWLLERFPNAFPILRTLLGL